MTRLQLNGYENEERTGPLVLLQEEIEDLHSYSFTTEQHPELVELDWDVVESLPGQVIFRTVVREKTLQIEKRYRLEENSHVIEFEVAFRNVGTERLNGITYGLGSGVGLPVESADHSPFDRKALIATLGADNSPQLETLTAFDIDLEDPQAFRGVTPVFWGTENRFFTSLVINASDDDTNNQLQGVDPRIAFGNPIVIATSKPLSLEPDAEAVHRYLLFHGPKDPPVLDRHAESGLPLLMDRGKFLFMSVTYIAKPVDAILRFTGSLLGDYGLALILTTCLIRVCMMPLTLRQRRNAAKLASLQPRLEALKEEYGKDKKGMADAQMQLYKEENFNPMGGCFISMAVALLFVGAWQGLLDSFPLRHAELLWGLTWIHDLSAPDRLFALGNAVPMIGNYFNLLPVLAMLLMFAGYSMYADGAAADGKKKQSILWKLLFCWLCYSMPAASWLCILTFLIGTRLEQILIPIPAEHSSIEPSDDSADTLDSIERDDVEN